MDLSQFTRLYQSSSTETPKNPYQITWIIQDFLKRKRLAHPLFSPHFPSTTVCSRGSKFQLKLSMNDKMLFFYVYMVEGKENQLADYRIFLLGKNFEKKYVVGGQGNFLAGAKELVKQQFNAIPLKNLADNGILVDGNLIICCQLGVSGWELHEESRQHPKSYADKSPATEKKANQLLDDFQSLFDTGKFSDFMLVFGGREFAVHKLILASRSHVFADLFNSQQLDEEDPRLIIDDIDAETGEEFLRYLYTEKVTNLKQLARGLLIAADKYELESLRRECEQALSSNLSICTAADTLLLANRHRSLFLQENCVEFITDHTQQVMATDAWKEVATNSELLNLLFNQLARKEAEGK